ncbi:MAG: hypothetical protein M9926_06085 [Lentimicrobium sp.]|uniref:hypothetical protein n=1 Tax=Lentimicrobium sp. TaxID=2034841 RepID=UPI0025D00149|nr:hypothetical protein [Lentimicrobium sp.]MCO5256314.1 hypothetical protein [Lentimicrobium sp.]
MMKETYPSFGKELKKVIQKDRTAKKVFILGVYASAVHARWVGPDGKTIVKALAVASEPEYSGRGIMLKRLLKLSVFRKKLDVLVPAARTLNGLPGLTLR